MANDDSELYQELCKYFENHLSPRIKRREDPHALANLVLLQVRDSDLTGEDFEKLVKTVRYRRLQDCLEKHIGTKSRSIENESQVDKSGTSPQPDLAQRKVDEIGESPSQHAAKLEEIARLNSAIHKLSAKSQKVINETLDGKKLSDIGDAIGKSTEAARSDRRRAEEKLNKELRKRGMNSESMQSLEGTKKKSIDNKSDENE